MPAIKNQPDSLTIIDKPTQKRVPAPGSPLARLQAVHDDADTGVLAGDLKDVLAQCDPKHKAVEPLVAMLVVDGKPLAKGERVIVTSQQVSNITAHLIAAAN